MSESTTIPGVRRVRVGMLGCGTVGQGLLELAQKHRADLLANGLDLQFTEIAVRDPARGRGPLPKGVRLCSDPLRLAREGEIDLLIEVMGGATTAVEAAEAALCRGIPVVTANKSALARHFGRYVEAARAGGATLAFEAAVAAHIPVIEVLERSLACEELSVVKGVINGSTNYILTYMERFRTDFETALADAAAKGFTEADPSLDVDGIDAAEKLSLLALKAFGVYFPPSSVYTEGIRHIARADMVLAEKLDHRIKLVAAARRTEAGLSLRVHPALIHRGELLADVDSEFNAVILEGPSFRELTFLGKGAGKLPTASAVLNDMVKLLRDRRGHLPAFRKGAGETLETVPASALAFCFFLRAALCDGCPEEAVRQVLEERKISILSSVRAQVDGVEWLGLITDVTGETPVREAMRDLERLVKEKARPAFLRLDRDNYREIVEQEQRGYFGSGLQRQPGPGV